MIGTAVEPDAPYDVHIKWTSFGIPHITAGTFESLAFGVGYAYARDNLTVLADCVLTVRGIRSLHFGADTRVPHELITNLDSDFFHRSYFDPLDLETRHRESDPRGAAMLLAYAHGVNHWLGERGGQSLAAPYRQLLALEPITPRDLYLLLAQQSAQTSGYAFATNIVTARPPDGATRPQWRKTDARDSLVEGTHRVPLGSNAFAIGRDLTRAGTGILVGNPHFPWYGRYRLFQMHLTVPGELDVMGASLPPFPLINIGFNHDVAWTHTVSPSRRFVVYELPLARHCSTAYRVAGQIQPMSARTFSVPVRDEEGRQHQVQRTLYTTRYGPIFTMENLGCSWSSQYAYALCDTAVSSVGMLKQWLAINQARSVEEVNHSLAQHRGPRWLTTVATDKHGKVFYGDLSAVPNATWWQRISCKPSRPARLIAEREGVVVLDGSRRRSIIPPADKGHTSALRSAKKMPTLIRSDYVLNCNDSHWLANARAPLTGFPRFVGAEHTPQGLRTRMAHRELSDLIERRRGRLDAEDLKEMLFSNRNYAAELVLDHVLAAATRHPVAQRESGERDLTQARRALCLWNRRDDIDSAGAVLFREFWRRAQRNEAIWQVPFDRNSPLTSPRGLRVSDPQVAQFLSMCLTDAMDALTNNGHSPDVRLGAVQRILIGGEPIPIPGGPGCSGVLNLMEFGPLTPSGYDPSAIEGSSYTQVVTWEEGRVVADAILPISQSADPSSPHSADQTRVFSRKDWIRLPFYPQEIDTDSQLSEIHLRHSGSQTAAAGSSSPVNLGGVTS